MSVPHHYWCDTRLSPSWSPWSLWPHLVSPAARPCWPPWGCMRWCPPCPWSAWTPCLPYVVITADLVGACCELCWLTGSPLSPSPHSRTLWPGAGTQHPPLAWQAGPHTPAWPLLTVSGERERGGTGPQLSREGPAELTRDNCLQPLTPAGPPSPPQTPSSHTFCHKSLAISRSGRRGMNVLFTPWCHGAGAHLATCHHPRIIGCLTPGEIRGERSVSVINNNARVVRQRNVPHVEPATLSLPQQCLQVMRYNFLSPPVCHISK